MKKIIISMLLIILMISFFSIKSFASSTDINPSNGEFKDAKKNVYSDISHKIEGYSDRGSLSIFHYKACENGYYAIYTIGNTDTVGKVYEEQNFLWWTTKYDDKTGSVDDYVSPLNEYSSNFKVIIELDKGEDYYICVRAYGSNSGKYDLIIEPNDDRITSYNGGVWTTNNTQWGNQPSVIVSYYTKEQVAILVQILRNEITRNIIHDYYVDKSFVGVVRQLNNLLGLGLSFAQMGEITSPAVAFSQYGFECFLENVFYKNDTEMTAMLANIMSTCNADWNVENGHDNYYSDNGLKIEDFILPDGEHRINLYYAWNSYQLVGHQYHSGTWNLS